MLGDVPRDRSEPGWTQKAALPFEVTENAAAGVGQGIYVVGGFQGLTLPNTVVRYDVGTDAWAEVAEFPKQGYHHMSLVSADGLIFSVAGHNGLTFTPSDAVFVYDPAFDAWSPRAVAPRPRGGAAAAFVGGRIWVVGGVTDQGLASDLVAYDPGTDMWAADFPSMADTREHLAACALEGRMHVFGGRRGGLNNVNTHEAWDPATETWETLEPLPTARGGIAAAALDGRCHVFGGEADEGTFNENEAWSPEEGWTTWPVMPTARHGLAAVTVNQQIFVLAGGPEPGFFYSSKNEVFSH